jgi:hypothetical protein
VLQQFLLHLQARQSAVRTYTSVRRVSLVSQHVSCQN